MLQTIFWFWFWKLVTARFFLICLEIIIIISRNQTTLKIFKNISLMNTSAMSPYLVANNQQ